MGLYDIAPLCATAQLCHLLRTVDGYVSTLFAQAFATGPFLHRGPKTETGACHNYEHSNILPVDVLCALHTAPPTFNRMKGWQHI